MRSTAFTTVTQGVESSQAFMFRFVRDVVLAILQDVVEICMSFGFLQNPKTLAGRSNHDCRLGNMVDV